LSYLFKSVREISDFKPVYDVLKRYPNLKELNLCENLLRDLPKDLSGLRYLANLNLNGNQFDNVKDSIAYNDISFKRPLQP